MAAKLLYLLLLFSTSVWSEVIEMNRNRLPSVVMKDFDFFVMNFVDNSKASEEAIRIFESAEQSFSEIPKNTENIGWGQVNIEKFPDLNRLPKGVAIPAQLIVGYNQVLSV